MANVIDKIAQIRNAILGKDVRESLASGIEAINTETESTTNRQTTLETQFNEQIKNLTLQDPSSAELVAARTKEDATTYPTIGERLNGIDSSLAEKANNTDVETSLLDKRDKNVLINQNDITDELRKQITGQTPINAVPNKGSITKDRLSKKIIGQEQTSFLGKGKNYFNKNEVLAGYFINTVGDLITNASYSTTDYIGVKPNTNYYRNLTSTIAFYDASFTFISREYETSGLITSPSNAVYARIALSNGYIPNFQFEEGSASTTKEDFYLTFDSLKLKELNFQNKIIPLESMKNLVLGKNKFNKADVVNGQLDMGTGIVDGGLEGYTSNLIEVQSSIYYSKNYSAVFAFYDENKAFITVPLGTGEGQYHSGMTSFITPSNAKYIRIGANSEKIDSLQFEEGTTSTMYEPFGYRVDGLLYSNDINKLKEPSKIPFPTKTIKNIFLPGSNTHVFGDIDKDGNIWTVAWQDLIRKSKDGINFKTIIDAKPFLDKANGETISLYAFMVTDTDRIVVATNKGRVLVSDEEQTTLTEAFVFENGFTQNSWGYDKKGRYILMATYSLEKSETSQGREVYLSKDFGATWERIFYKPIEEMIDSMNYHIHDVAFDQYSDCILISIGDDANRQIHYSYDYGVTWNNMFDESIYNASNPAPIHPTSIIVFPHGYAFGSDELPEGISWWNRPKGVEKPEIKWEDCEYKFTFNENASLIGTFAQKGDMLQTESGIYGVMPFRNHNTTTEGHTRLFATGDGGRTWHEIFKEDVWDADHKGFLNARMRKEGDGIYIYSGYSKLGNVHIWRAKLPNFIDG